jgi:O-antigen/teichoic acid export membrane protein
VGARFVIAPAREAWGVRFGGRDPGRPRLYDPPVRGSEHLEVGARHLTLDVAVQIFARIANLALGVVVTLVLVHALGSSSFGLWSTIFAITQITSSFGELGLTQIAVSRAAREPDREPEWLGSLLSLRLLLAVPITLASIVAVFLLVSSHDGRVTGTLLSLVLLVGAAGTLNVVFQLRVRNHISMAILTLNSIVWGAGVIVVALLSGGIVAFAAVFLGTSLFTTTLTVGLASRIAALRMRGTRRLWRPMLRVGLGLGAAGILVTLYVKLDQILVFKIAGSHQAGLYGADYRLLDQIQFIPTSVMTTLFPLIAAAYPHNRDRVRNLLQVTGEYLTMASLPILAFTIVAAHQIVTLLFGEQFGAAAPALPILAGAFVSISFGYLVGNMVVILELQRLFLRYAAIGLLLNAALNVLLIPHYGFLAAAWITLLTEVTVMSMSMRRVLQKLRMRPQLQRLGRTLLGASAMGLAVWLARALGVPLGGLAAVAAVTYLPSLLLLGVLTREELLSVLRRKPLAAMD